jgi:hypothetical protein
VIIFRKWMQAGSLALLGIFFFQAAGYAETLEGRVSKVYPSALDIVVYDAAGRPYPNSLPVKVKASTKFSGVTSLNRLRPNDAVGVSVHQEESRVWVADQVTRFQQVNAKPATQKPSPTLRDVLGNPVARGALTGAASGALASGLSGGKAGKGALVGAGVGAAAGLLEGLFSRPSNPSSSDSSNSQ